MQPEETRVTTRITGPAPDVQATQTGLVLAAIDSALEEHADWMRMWHRAVICRIPGTVEKRAGERQGFAAVSDWHAPERGIPAQQIFQELREAFCEMRECGRALLPKAVAAGSLETGEYDEFAGKIAKFERLARRVRQAFQQAAIDLDPLTGVRGRRNMMDELEREKARALRMGTSFGLALCDIDHFKSVNDRLGHQVGDAVLLSVASRLVSKLRPYDSLFRYGGEEFLIALPDSTLSMTVSIAKRLCRVVRAAPIVIDGGAEIDTTISLGVCMVDADLALPEAIERSDRALYAAKHRGRDRVVAWDAMLGGKVGK